MTAYSVTGPARAGSRIISVPDRHDGADMSRLYDHLSKYGDTVADTILDQLERGNDATVDTADGPVSVVRI